MSAASAIKDIMTSSEEETESLPSPRAGQTQLVERQMGRQQLLGFRQNRDNSRRYRTSSHAEGKAISKDQTGAPLQKVEGHYLSGSSAEIEWNDDSGTLVEAFLSIGWYRGDDTNRHFTFTVYGPEGGGSR